MGIFGDIFKGVKGAVGLVTGGLGSKIIEGVENFFPNSMSEQEKGILKLKIMETSNKQEIEILKELNESDRIFNQRLKETEGTAQDLKSLPVVGTLIIFLRGAFRPLFAYAIAYVDLKVFSSSWIIKDEQIISAFWIVNLLVLGFYFGERTIKNILPMLKTFLKK